MANLKRTMASKEATPLYSPAMSFMTLAKNAEQAADFNTALQNYREGLQLLMQALKEETDPVNKTFLQSETERCVLYRPIFSSIICHQPLF